MAKGKKSSGTSYTSKGERSNVSRSTRAAMRREYIASGERIVNQMKAHRAGKRVMVTIANPNKEETNRPFIRVPGYIAFKSSEDEIKRVRNLYKDYKG